MSLMFPSLILGVSIERLEISGLVRLFHKLEFLAILGLRAPWATTGDQRVTYLTDARSLISFRAFSLSFSGSPISFTYNESSVRSFKLYFVYEKFRQTRFF